MKNLCLLSAIMLIFVSCGQLIQSQTKNVENVVKDSTKYVDVQGIGILKINQTKFDDIRKLTSIKVVKNNDRYGAIYTLGGEKLKAIEIINAKHERTYESHIIDSFNFVQGFRFLKLYNFNIGNDIIRELELTFFQDTLFRIKTDWDLDITKAFELKYGKPKVIISRDKRREYSILSNLSNEDEYNFMVCDSHVWNGGRIIADDLQFWNDVNPMIHFIIIYDTLKENFFNKAKIDFLNQRQKEINDNYKKNY